MREIFERSEAFVSCVELIYIFKEQRYNWNLLKPRSFDIYKNIIVPMIIILGCLEVGIEILDIDMKTIRSDDCRELLRDNRDANSMLAIM